MSTETMPPRLLLNNARDRAARASRQCKLLFPHNLQRSARASARAREPHQNNLVDPPGTRKLGSPSPHRLAFSPATQVLCSCLRRRHRHIEIQTRREEHDNQPSGSRPRLRSPRSRRRRLRRRPKMILVASRPCLRYNRYAQLGEPGGFFCDLPPISVITI
jgi:hypothetical protein